MAPRRGGGGGGGSSSTSSCPGAFSLVVQQVSFANSVLFFAVMLGISIAMCIMRKRTGAGKRLIGIPFIASVSCLIVAYACSIIAVVLQECGVTNFYNFYNWVIAIDVFYRLGYWLLLFVVVFTLNTMLRAQLGHTSAIFKYTLLAILGLMAVLTCVLVGITAYNNHVMTDPYYRYYNDALYVAAQGIRVAYHTLYLVSVLASGALALKTIMSLRSRRNAAGDLIGWVIALFIAMVLWVVIMIVYAAWIYNPSSWTWEADAALSYIANAGQALSYIFILCIAKHASWSRSSIAEPIANHDAYAGMAPQQYYAPVNNGAMYPTKA